jgi:hypothetical protein
MEEWFRYTDNTRNNIFTRFMSACKRFIPSWIGRNACSKACFTAGPNQGGGATCQARSGKCRQVLSEGEHWGPAALKVAGWRVEQAEPSWMRKMDEKTDIRRDRG